MKDEAHINNLLNGYIDDELTTRQQTELKRLLLNDPELAGRLDKMQRCQQLVKMSPEEKAPADMLDRVKSAVATKAAPHAPSRVEELAPRKNIVDILASEEGLSEKPLGRGAQGISSAPVGLSTTDSFMDIFKPSVKPDVTEPAKKIKIDVPEHVKPVKAERHESVLAYMFRRYAGAAALFGLVLILAFVVFQIVKSPEPTAPAGPMVVRTDEMVTIPESPTRENILKVEEPALAKDLPITLPADLEQELATVENGDVPAIVDSPAILRDYYELNLIAKDSLIAENQLKALLRDNPEIEYKVLAGQSQSAAYSFDLKPGQLRVFLVGMESLWDNFTDNSLAVQTDEAGKPIVVHSASLPQITAIMEQQNMEKRVKAANYYAMINNVEKFWAEEDDIADSVNGDILDNVPTPKPVLTRDEYAEASIGDSAETRVHLTIVISMGG